MIFNAPNFGALDDDTNETRQRGFSISDRDPDLASGTYTYNLACRKPEPDVDLDDVVTGVIGKGIVNLSAAELECWG